MKRSKLLRVSLFRKNALRSHLEMLAKVLSKISIGDAATDLCDSNLKASDILKISPEAAKKLTPNQLFSIMHKISIPLGEITSTKEFSKIMQDIEEIILPKSPTNEEEATPTNKFN